MPRVGFEPTIPAFERPKTIHALDRAATVIGDQIVAPVAIPPHTPLCIYRCSNMRLPLEKVRKAFMQL
jgi:hypothetical protein